MRRLADGKRQWFKALHPLRFGGGEGWASRSLRVVVVLLVALLLVVLGWFVLKGAVGWPRSGIEPFDQHHAAFLVQKAAGLLQVVDQPTAAHRSCNGEARKHNDCPRRCMLRFLLWSGLGKRWRLCRWFVDIHVYRHQEAFTGVIERLLVEHLSHHLLGPQVPVSTGGRKPDGQGKPTGT